MSLQVRFATPSDADVVFRFIVALAEYEREPDAVQTSPQVLARQLAEPSPPFECLIAELGGEPVGFALFFHTYSTWMGRRGIHLEDLFVLPEHRRSGVGRALFGRCAALARERGCARLEWAVLDWNHLAIDFYGKLGSQRLGEWTTFRLDGQALARLQ